MYLEYECYKKIKNIDLIKLVKKLIQLAYEKRVAGSGQSWLRLIAVDVNASRHHKYLFVNNNSS